MSGEFELIAKTFNGLEEILAGELIELGANNVEIGRRMVSFTGDKRMMYKANFCLRTAIRILKPIKKFVATTADEVYDEVKSIDWSKYLDNSKTFVVDAVVYSEEFRHSKFVAYRVKDAIADHFNEKTGKRPSVRISNPDIAINVHISHKECTISLDSSGESLHRRGYRQETMEAPLNEVLAAGIIMMSGWKGECDFIDPMCGSGTLPIEAALIARNIAPGVFRKGYGFEKWNDFDADLFEQIYNDDSLEKEFEHKIYGYDINYKANAIAERNVKAAGVGKDVILKVQPIQEFTKPASKSIIITNPPYGERISSDDLLGLYATIGEKLKHEFSGNTAWILSYRDECFNKISLKESEKIKLYNGALECQLRKYDIFDGKYKAYKEKVVKGEISEDKRGEYRSKPTRKEGFKERRKDDRREFGKEKREYKSITDRKPREGRSFNKKSETDSREYRSDKREYKPKTAKDRFFKEEKPISTQETRTFRSRKHKSDKPKP